MPSDDFEAVVASRLRGLRVALGWSLDELAARTHLSPSTISRIETGKRSISLDLLQPLCRALQTDVNTLLDISTDDEDVIIRPIATMAHGMTTWPLTRNGANNGVVAAKVRLEPIDQADLDACGEPRVHPGHDWFFVLSGSVLLTLGDREIIVEEGEAAEFSTMTPHRFVAHGGAAEIISIFDRDGQHAHLNGPGDRR